MTAVLAWVLAGLGLAVVAARPRGLAVGLVTAQAVILVGLGWAGADGGSGIHAEGGSGVHAGVGGNAALTATAALAVRTVVVAVLLGYLTRRTRDTRPVRAALSPLRATAVAAGLALALLWLVPGIGFPSRAIERAVLAMVAFGLATVATSRATLSQVIGLVAIENALVLGALQLPGTSWLIELGLAFDLMLLVAVAGVLHRRIVAEFGAGDTAALEALRD